MDKIISGTLYLLLVGFAEICLKKLVMSITTGEVKERRLFFSSRPQLSTKSCDYAEHAKSLVMVILLDAKLSAWTFVCLQVVHPLSHTDDVSGEIIVCNPQYAWRSGCLPSVDLLPFLS